MKHLREWRPTWAVGMTLLLIAVVLLTTLGGVAQEAPRAAAHRVPVGVAAVFGQTTPAANTTALTLAVDSRKVLGWISGAESRAGREVTVAVAGRTESVVVQADNTFTWHYKAGASMMARFTVGKLSRRIVLVPPKPLPPTAFFIADRTAYRPGQELKFAAFLRKVGPDGQFQPLSKTQVEVVLRSKNKKAVAAKLKLTSDALGRIDGSYRFSPEDALDEYTLSVSGYHGAATVRLAEFRKAKVRLDITAERRGDKLHVSFEARDFLNKPVPAERVQFTMRVLRRGVRKKTHALKGEQFAYHDADFARLPDPDDLTAVQMYRWLYENVWPQTNYVVLTQKVDKIELGGRSRGEYEIPLQQQWLDGQSTVSVEAVLVDENGREQRAAKSVPLTGGDLRGGRRLVVELPKRAFSPNEPIPVRVRLFDRDGKARAVPSDTAVVAIQASSLPYQARRPIYYQNQLGYGHLRSRNQLAYNNIRYASRSAMPYYQPVWPSPGYWGDVGRVVTATCVRGGKASVKLPHKGVHKIVVIAHVEQGRTLRESVGCTIVPDDGRCLAVKLDKTDLRAGDVLGGEIHCRYRGARVLLTLRDSRGLRLWRVMKLDGEGVRFQQRLPRDLKYGCTLTARYVAKDARVHVAQKNIRVEPTDRMLDIATTMKEVVEPGEKVKIGIKVNRKKPVDLVVSVYDQSLLGIAPDKSADIRNFYLADERVFHSAAWDILYDRLGDVTVEQLIERAKAIMKKPAKDRNNQWAPSLVSLRPGSHLNMAYVQIMLNFAGVRCRYAQYVGGWRYTLNKEQGATHRLVDVIRTLRSDHWRLIFRYYGDLLVVAETHPTYRHRAGSAYSSRSRRGGSVRGDAHYSASANAMRSVSAQSFISHMPAAMPAPIAELAPDTPSGKIAVRRDFSDSAFWNARVRTNDRGEANVEVKLPDSLTNWRVVVTAVSSDMHVGHHTAGFRSYKPIMVWPMIPRSFTCGDKVRVFARAHNRTDKPQDIRVKLKVENGKVLDRDTVSVRVQPKDSAAVYWTFQPDKAGFTQLLMTADCKVGADASLKRLPVVPACTVRQTVTASGFCEDAAEVVLPEDALIGGKKLEIALAPSLIADMVDTLDYLVTYPHGCVEQTMSRFLPAIKVAQILKKLGIRHKSLETKLPRCVSGGIKRLLQLQRSDGGWGWNGNSATHEMMTPYALYGLLEAERAGYKIPNEAAVEKGLTRLRKFIDAMGEKAAADRIYCIYVYTLRKPMADAWWQFIADQSKKGKLSDYATAMALEIAVRSGKKDLAAGLAAQLRRRANLADGKAYWTTAKFSRWGNDRHEITAAVFKAIVALDVRDPLVGRIIRYFASTKRGKRWNSTKDTALILFAMCDYLAKKDLTFKRGSTVAVRVNGEVVGKVAVTGHLMKRAVIRTDRLRKGKNVVRFENATPGTMYRLVYEYHKLGTDVPAFGRGVRVTRQFHLVDKKGKQLREIKPGDSVPRGSYLLSTVVVRRAPGGTSMSYALVESPKPSSCEIVPVTDGRFRGYTSTRHVLREDKTVGVLYHHERTGYQIVDRSVFHAELAGEFVVPPARVELMYKTDVHGHSGTFRLNVKEVQ